MANQENGIHWREWSEASFNEAREQNKLVLLDIGAVWCHWCHVMDTGIAGDPIHTGTYINPEVIKLIEKYYIPVKVDNDKRPDINSRYNMGGWPTTAFLTPEGEMIYGETYVYPERMVGLLQYIADLYADNKSELHQQMVELKEKRDDALSNKKTLDTLDPLTRDRVLSEIERNYDPLYGGFGNDPKFPHADLLMFLVEQAEITKDQDLKKIAIKTLRGMDSFGMYDRFAGGFFRYSTNRDWSIPHYEKMLEDNAKLTKVYAMASIVFDDEHSMQTVRSSHRWLLSDMLDSKIGTFAGSQDADQEEKYYGKTLDIRVTMPTPFIDRTVYTNWNSLMVSSLAYRYMLTGESEILDTAIRTYDFLINILAISDDIGLRFYHYYVSNVSTETFGLLVDQSSFINASLDLYEVTGEPRFLTYAIDAADYTLDSLEDQIYGGFFDIPLSPKAIGELSRPNTDINENSDMAIALIRLANYSNQKYIQSAQNALAIFSDQYHNHSFMAAQYARAVEWILKPTLQVVISGGVKDERTVALQKVAWQFVSSGKITETIDPELNHDRLEATGYKPGKGGTPLAYVCVGEKCLKLVNSPDELEQLLHSTIEMRQQQIVQVK